ncbi:hypothetical protein ACQPZP_07880 [Spirillospora sp. CA-142024]|uniref:hypothetical protein n=1 Tax=Spirillospora sp. CA-142024 TaxID=3240036 RepID=UPI003D8A391B
MMISTDRRYPATLRPEAHILGFGTARVDFTLVRSTLVEYTVEQILVLDPATMRSSVLEFTTVHVTTVEFAAMRITMHGLSRTVMERTSVESSVLVSVVEWRL